jgi:hypothetical protein
MGRIEESVKIRQRALEEALAALYGARECLGDVANIQHAIDLIELHNFRSGKYVI